MGDIILWVVITAAVVGMVFAAPSIKRWYQNTFLFYNEETGYWEKKPKKKAVSAAPKKKADTYKSRANTAREPAKSAPKPKNVNNSSHNYDYTRSYAGMSEQEKSVARSRESRDKISELRKAKPNGNIKFETGGAQVTAMARTADVVERLNGKDYKAVREFVVSFDGELGLLHFAIDEKTFNSLSIGAYGMLTLADGDYFSFEPFLKDFDLFK